MGKQQIGAKEVLNDIKSGLTDAELGKKYGLSPKGLESLFRKLIAAKLLDEAFVLKRSAAEAADKAGKQSSAPAAASSQAAKGPAQPSDLALAVAQDIKDGKHDAEIMRVHELSPGMLSRIRSELVEAGLLAAPSLAAPEGGPTMPCPFCGRNVDESATECVYCGRLLQSSQSAELPAPPTTPRPFSGARHEEVFDEDDDKECPWEDREAYGTLNAYFQTATKCLVTPTRFFQKLPLTDGYFSPIKFAAMSVPIILFTVIVGAKLMGIQLGVGLISLLFMMSCGFLGAGATLAVGITIWSALVHLCLYLVGGANSGYQASFRVVAYSSVTNLFSIIPFVGTIASLYGIVLQVIGLRETHKTTTGTAVLAVAIPTGAIFLIGIIAAIAIPASLVKAASKGVPPQACAFVEAYIARVDAAANLDAELIENEVYTAMNDLRQELLPFKGNLKVAVMQQKAYVFGVAIVQRNKGSQESIKTVGQLREDLRRTCRK